MQRKLTAVLALSSLITAGISGATAGVAVADVTELPVYGVRGTGLTPEQALQLQRALNLDKVDRSEHGAVSFVDKERYQYLPTVDKGQGRPDEDGLPTQQTGLDLERLRQIRVIPTDEAAKRAGEALRRAGVLPENVAPVAQHTTFDLSDVNGRTALTQPLDTAVSYSFQLGGIPLEGEGANIRLSFDGAGAVTSVSHAVRDLAKVGSAKVYDLVEGQRICQKYLGGEVKAEAGYVYAAPALDQRIDQIEPSFRCGGTKRDGESVQAVILPAVVGAELPKPTPPQPPRQQSFSTQNAGVQVGSEGTGNCAGLPNTAANIGTFNAEAAFHAVPLQFSWLDANAWETDFKDPAFPTGQDTYWADDVDLTYWQGHGSGTGFYFTGCSNINDTKLANTEARWGDNDVEWMSLFTCLILEDNTGGQTWAQRWGQAFRGLHQINSFTTVSYNSANHGGKYGHYLWNDGLKVRVAWAQASIDTQPASVRWASMGVYLPSSGGLGNFDDYFHGMGSVGPDYASTGWFWRISGAS